VSALLHEALAPLRSEPATSAVLLDIDGTLSPIVKNAANASVPETTRRILIAIARRYRLVACVSGRRASDARAMVAIGTITYIGSHGAELLEPGGGAPVLDPQLHEWAERVHAFAGSTIDAVGLQRVGVRLEDKGAIVALHWRGARDEDAAHAAVEALAAQATAAGFAVHWGRKVMEVRPPVQIDKGAGITSLIERTGVTQALYAGDDVTDLDAFRALVSLTQSGTLRAAVRVGVRSDDGPPEIEAEADLVVDGTAGVQELLATLAAE
jgi:trehalose 6-phosphate phosphatase